MTDVKSGGHDADERGTTLCLGQHVYQLIAAGRSDLQHRNGLKAGKPNLSRIAREAGIKRQRMSDPIPTPRTMGALVEYYMRVHGVTKEHALGAVLDTRPDTA